MPRRAATLILLSPLLALVGCSSEDIETEELETSVATELDHFEVSEPDVDCPDALTSEVGAELTCAATGVDSKDQDVTYEVKLTVYEVADDETLFEIDIPELTVDESEATED